MGTHHTGIPLTGRNIQPPPIPIVRMVINEVVPNYANDTKVFYVTITGSNGYYATYVPISVSQPIILNNLQYGTYYISQNADGGYTQISVTPSSFTLSADNPQQTVTITTVKNVGQVTVTKTITGVTEDETYFDITITGTNGEYVEQFGQVRLGEPLTFEDLPFGTYEITEAETEGYTLDSITPSDVVLDVNTLTADVEIVNSVDAGITIIKYGALYNWYAAGKNGGIGDGSIAPDGWHLPSGDDFTALLNYFTSIDLYSGELKEEGVTYWEAPNTAASSYAGFKWRGAGRRVNTGVFNDINIYNSLLGVGAIPNFVYSLRMENNFDTAILEVGEWRTDGHSIRLIKNNSTDDGIVTDYDGNIYPTVKIGDQVWMAANLVVTHYNDGTPIPNVTDDSEWTSLTTGAMCYYNNDISNAFIF